MNLQLSILEEIKDLITEGEFAARDILIQTYYKVGRMIIENNLETQRVANYIGRSERSVQYMVKFARDTKALDKVSKEESWSSIIRNKLTTGKEHQHDFKMRCYCGVRE